MTLDASNVEVAVSGAVYFAPLGTTLPATSSAPLDPAFKAVGYLSADGITENTEADVTAINAWQNGDEVRTVQTTHAIRYGFTMIETNEASLTAYYGDYNAGKVEVTGKQLPRQAMVIEVIDNGMIRRRTAEVAQVTERGEVSLVNADATGYPVTVTCYPGSDGKTKVTILPAAPFVES